MSNTKINGMALRFWFKLVFCIPLLYACNKPEPYAGGQTKLTGSWKLIETLTDPGDGSGTWKPVPAAMQTAIIFNPDGSLQGNAFPQARRYELLDGVNIRFTYEDGTFINYYYTITGLELVLSGGGCIEACGAKFIKTDTLHW